MRIIQEDMGQPATAIFSELSTTSVAAASLGQVTLTMPFCVHWNSTCVLLSIHFLTLLDFVHLTISQEQLVRSDDLSPAQV